MINKTKKPKKTTTTKMRDIKIALYNIKIVLYILLMILPTFPVGHILYL